MQGTEITGICVCHNLSQDYDTMNDQKFVDVLHRTWHILFCLYFLIVSHIIQNILVPLRAT